MEKVTVRVPASTSNLGPGFDCLGLALRLYNEVTITRGRSNAPHELICCAADKFFTRSGTRPFAFSCTIRGHVPLARGLGSSATLRLGALCCFNELTSRRLSREELFELCAELEGHPDNAAPAAFGGFNVIAAGYRQRFPIASRLRVVLLVPDFEVRTTAARKLLPPTVPHSDAVRNAANVARIAAGFCSGDFEQLRGAFADYLHQPFRKQLVPRFDEIVAAAESAGALGAFLSGSGSTIAALTLDAPRRVAAAMHEAAQNPGAITIITSTDNRGARLLRPNE